MSSAASSSAAAPPATWDARRWRAILDRMEHRDASVGLRFWGPPLWVEVTMSGPDSDAWSSPPDASAALPSWDWLSGTTCDLASAMEADGAGDDALLEVAARYTVENLVLNATHEIGEWLRFDGARLFPAHLHPSEPGRFPGDDATQGNGSVEVRFVAPSAPPARTVGAPRHDVVVQRAQLEAAGWRYTSLPGETVTLHGSGPAVADGRGRVVTGRWSAGTVAAASGPTAAFVSAIHEDVHTALVRAHAEWICAAFHVDGAPRWALAGTAPAAGRRTTELIDLDVRYDAIAPSASGVGAGRV